MEEQKSNFVQIFRANLCNVTETCRKANVKSRQTFYKWIAEDPEFKAAIDSVQEEMLDFAESQLMLLLRGVPKYAVTENEDGEKIRSFDGWKVTPDRYLLRFFLLTKGKHRGYVERKEIELSTPEYRRLMEMGDDEIKTEIQKLLKAQDLISDNGDTDTE